jgi:hypothetical protein
MRRGVSAPTSAAVIYRAAMRVACATLLAVAATGVGATSIAAAQGTPPATPPPAAAPAAPATGDSIAIGGAPTGVAAPARTDSAPAASKARHGAARRAGGSRTKHAAQRHARGRVGLTDEELATRWPVKGPDPMPGSILPHSRIVAYYGNPLSKRMGILGQIPPDSMLARLAGEVRAYAAADSATPVVPALELIVTVAQAGPGADGKYRLRMPDTLVDRVAGWADRVHALLILDVQPGRSTVADELKPWLKYLQRPTVHLALDPEFTLPPGKVPGRVIGTMDAAAVNDAVSALANLVERYHLPPKVLIVHRFTRPMLRHADQIRPDPRVQVVIDMDGFGPEWMKRDSYRAYVASEPVQYTGFKLFYKNDKPVMAPHDVVGLFPAPLFVMFQ